MSSGVVDELRDQGRGITGALLVIGLSLTYTMETWWRGWQLPVVTLLVYALVGLAIVLAITRYVGFREQETGKTQFDIRRVVTDFAELLAQSFLTAYAILLIFGVITLDDSAYTIARLGLILVVPMGFGAALANHLLGGEKSHAPLDFPKNLALFSLGALFLTAPIAPTGEIDVLASTAGWWRQGAIVVASILLSYLMLYELEFQGQQRRTENRQSFELWGSVFIAYVVAFVISASLLAAFGHFSDLPPTVWVQQTVVLAFPASIGGSAAQVIV